MLEIIKLGNKTLLHHSIDELKPYRDARHYHSHIYYEISIIRAGKGVYKVNDKLYEFEPGDIFVFNNQDKHALTIPYDNVVINEVIHFEPSLIWQTNDHFYDQNYLSIFLNRADDFSPLLSHNNKNTVKIIELFDGMQEEYLLREADYHLMIKAKLLTILVLLGRSYQVNHQTIHHANEHIHGSQIVIDYINNNYHTSIHLDDLASIMHMNPSYFSRFFKKYYGLSPTQYITHIRISKACHLLIDSQLTITEISQSCGFNQVSSFNKAFKKIHNLSPSDYLKIKL